MKTYTVNIVSDTTEGIAAGLKTLRAKAESEDCDIISHKVNICADYVEGKYIHNITAQVKPKEVRKDG